MSDFNTIVYRATSEFSHEDWNSVLEDKNIYLSLGYLCALESTLTEDADYYFSITYNSKKQACTIASYQLVKLASRKSRRFFKVNRNILVCGNVYCDGENGFVNNNLISLEQTSLEISKSLLQIQKELSCRITGVLLKDFWPKTTSDLQYKKLKYTAFNIDVNMLLAIDSNWNSMEDYLKSMKTKYRTRAKSVFRKSGQLAIKKLTSDDILSASERIDQLFESVLDNSAYEFGKMRSKTFAALKNALKEDFIFRGFYLDNKMVGFSTSFYHKGHLEANYVGIDYQLNIEHAIYQRMLYDYVEMAIERNAYELQLGRTSELVKSAIGALPVHMTLYAKFRSPLTHLFFNPVLKKAKPSKFELRKPFKANHA